MTRLDRGRNLDERRKTITDFDFKVTRLRYRHPVEKNFLKTIYTISTPRGIPKRSFVAYEWHAEPYEVFGLPHGNSRYTVDSYQPAMASEREVGRGLHRFSFQLISQRNHRSCRRVPPCASRWRRRSVVAAVCPTTPCACPGCARCSSNRTRRTDRSS